MLCYLYCGFVKMQVPEKRQVMKLTDMRYKTSISKGHEGILGKYRIQE